MHVIGCGARVFADLDLAACFARPHGCAVAVDRAQAMALAGRYFDEFELRLEWTSDQEFRWSVSHDSVELAIIAVHVPGDIRPGAGAPTVPLRLKTREKQPR